MLVPHINEPSGTCPEKVCGIGFSDLKFYSQIRQDYKILHDFFCLNSRKYCGEGRVVVDIGANDGVTGSNSLFFEEFLDWKSFCIEANPEVFELLMKNRPNCVNVHAALGEETNLRPFISRGPIGGLVEKIGRAHV